MVRYQFIDDKLQGYTLNGQSIIGAIASLSLNWQNIWEIVVNSDGH